ncbi:MAG: AMMECR1 domain-containing protein [Ignavibacteriae bacterium]|nr:MAG: AMMECR1 domain-containing protein [Ignavibacteriota bacterium]
MELNSKEKEYLIELAKFEIQKEFDENLIEPKFEQDSKVLKSKSGVFVTLTINNKLRGCIGYITSDRKLIETIKDASYHAAFNDNRFTPVSKEESQKLKFEISILSEPFDLNSYEEIEIGKHGLILDENYTRALLLPQVPIEHNMNKDQYLSALCEKGGIHKDYWKEKQLKLKAFTATVFSEKEKDNV